jgi:hypothetical protein
MSYSASKMSKIKLLGSVIEISGFLVLQQQQQKTIGLTNFGNGHEKYK